jgi:hypothetical protein
MRRYRGCRRDRGMAFTGGAPGTHDTNGSPASVMGPLFRQWDGTTCRGVSVGPRNDRGRQRGWSSLASSAGSRGRGADLGANSSAGRHWWCRGWASRPDPTPLLGPALGVGQVDELLAATRRDRGADQRLSRLGLGRERLPGAGNALEFVIPAVLELDTGSDNEILDRSRDQHLSRSGQSPNPGSDVDG